MRGMRIAALLLAVALLLCGCASEEERAYRAAKEKLEAARNFGGGRLEEDRDAAWREALDALVEVGEYNDAPALADEARDYFYGRAMSSFWEFDRARAYLEVIPGYRDADDQAVLIEALALITEQKPAEAAALVRTLPETFDENAGRRSILVADACREEKWLEALEDAQALRPLLDDDGALASRVASVLSGSGLEVFADASSAEDMFREILLRYYEQQTDLGNDITTLEAWPCGDESVFGHVDLGRIYSERADRMRESLERYGVAEAYAKVGSVFIEKVARFNSTGTAVVGFEEVRRVEEGSVPEPPTEITGNGICLLETSNHFDGVRVDAHGLIDSIPPLRVADSVESARYVFRFYHDYTQTHRVVYSNGGEGGEYAISTSVQLIDLKTGETLLTCDYTEDQHEHKNNYGEVLNEKIMPAMRALVTGEETADD